MGEVAKNVDVSVVLPCYNVEAYLDQALCSVEKNTLAQVEIICVNDGSTDGTFAILRRHASSDARVRIIDKANGGYGAAVNRGFDEARGTYVAILEPDDWVEAHMYDDLLTLARRYEAKGFGYPDIVKSSYWRIWMPGTAQQRRLHCSYFKRIRPSHQPFALIDCPRLIQHHPSIWSALYRRDFLRERKIRFKEVPGAGWVDNPFLIETMCQAKTIIYTDTPYYNYREDLPGSSSAMRSLDLSFERWNDMCDVMDRLGIHDHGIRRALDTIGFRYVGEAIGRGGLDDAELKAGMQRIFSRMGTDDILSLTNVSPQLRQLAFALTDRACLQLSGCEYFKALVKEFFYSVRVNGIGFALVRANVYRQRRQQQDANADPSKHHSTDMPAGM
jgi:glycosyltransferase involved in cell wall biosynthesis